LRSNKYIGQAIKGKHISQGKRGLIHARQQQRTLE
jgi:hypothetical protein